MAEPPQTDPDAQESLLCIGGFQPEGFYIFNFLSITLVPDQKISTLAASSNLVE
ncbi:MAG TPA: hypothetical protein VLA72_09285 [Anaerolineales bacterium]|nr:hypothetical protein [Anaerolineales bacterium]